MLIQSIGLLNEHFWRNAMTTKKRHKTAQHGQKQDEHRTGKKRETKTRLDKHNLQVTGNNRNSDETRRDDSVVNRRGKSVEGDLEQETRSDHAPFNKTYGTGDRE
jgi:hypothetical protein